MLKRHSRIVDAALRLFDVLVLAAALPAAHHLRDVLMGEGYGPLHSPRYFLPVFAVTVICWFVDSWMLIVEIGAAYFENAALVERRGMLVDPGVPIPEAASTLHGITDVEIYSAPRFSDVAGRFAAHLTGEAKGGEPPILAGFNSREYDVPLLNQEFRRAGIDVDLDPLIRLLMSSCL